MLQTLANEETLKSTADFVSALRNANNVKIFDLLEVLVMLLFSSLCSHTKVFCRKLQDYENIHGGGVSFHFHLQLCKSILEWTFL